MFNAIEAMLAGDENTFVIVLVDEIETLTARRENVMSGNEPIDGMRVSWISCHVRLY
jgi:ubiquinol-cytochrome c reductase cytochrome c1 subunit